MRTTAEAVASRAYVVVLTPIRPDGELLGQLGQGVEQDLSAMEREFGGRPLGRSAVQQLELGAGPVAFQAVWMHYPAVPEAPAHACMALEKAPENVTENVTEKVAEGRLYLLIERQVESHRRRVPLLFIGGPDALPTHLAALHELIASLTLSPLNPTIAASSDALPPVHTPWSD